MKIVFLALLSFVSINTYAAKWKYSSISCDNVAAELSLQKKVNENHFIITYPNKKVIEFQTVRIIPKSLKKETERYFYNYDQINSENIQMNQVNLKFKPLTEIITNIEKAESSKPFSYRMSFGIDSLLIQSEITIENSKAHCQTKYQSL